MLNAIIFLIDSEFKVKFVNESAAQKFNCKACDLIGKSAWSLLGDLGTKTGKENLLRVFSTGKPFQATTEVAFPTGPKVLATVLFPILNKRGKVSELLGVSYDLTERHEREQLVRNKMEIIMGYAELLQKLVDEGDAKEMIDKIVDAGTAVQDNYDSKKT